MIEYRDSLNGIDPENLKGFFKDWPNPPCPEVHLKILANSAFVILAVDLKSSQVVGFISAVSDKILTAYIPLLEVLSDYQGRGIGKELATRMIGKLQSLYMVDVCCDDNVTKFYESIGFQPTNGMILRNYQAQSGKAGQ